MQYHRFNPYLKDNERKAQEKARAQAAYKKQNREVAADPDKMKRIQRSRSLTSRAKKIPVTLPTIGLALLFLIPHPAEARCYSRWYYPTPQHCGGVYARVGIKHDLVDRYIEPTRMPDPPPLPPANDDRSHPIDIALPDMGGVTWGGAMDSQLELEMQRQKALRQLKGE